jgi:hypothetical protein
LEHILDVYIDMIEHGKIQAIPDDSEYEGPPTRQRPWIILPYSDYVLERTITKFNNLISAIQERMPNSGTGQSGLLADDATLEAAEINGFVKEFLRKVKKPTFKYIAPGIAIQTPEELRNQPYGDISPEQGDTRPILLFRGDGEASDLEAIFSRPFDARHTCPSGVYITPYYRTDDSPFQDAIKFVLPFGIGGNGFAKASDGGLIGEDRDSESDPTRKDMHDGLYTTGYNPYIEEHDLQLYRLLENWVDMVTEGHWQVDANGVAGGIEKFREADTEDHCEKYVILQDW